MTISLIKKKLHDYIENGDPKKIKAFYAMIENEVDEYTEMNDEFWKEMDSRLKDMELNFEEGITLSEMIAKARENHAIKHK